MNRLVLVLGVLAGCVAADPSAAKKPPADLIVYHAKIITVDVRNTIAEAMSSALKA